MLYAILCYKSEAAVGSWTKEHEDQVMTRLSVAQEKIARRHRFGPVARLMPTTAAATVRHDKEAPLVIDGPFAETKEQLLGFYLVECETREEAVQAAKEISEANPGGAHEVRPVAVYFPHGRHAGS